MAKVWDEWKINASFILPIISGSLSLMGSMTIVYMLLWRRKKLKIGRRYQQQKILSTTYDRLIFGMSVFDICGSSAVVLSTLPSPKDIVIDKNYGNWVGYGTTSTCSAQGFFYYVGMNGTTLYYCVLCVYYAIIIKGNYLKNRMTEVILHSIPIIYCLTTGIFLVATQHFNNAYAVCWISEHPRTCRKDRSKCERGQHSVLYRLVFTGTVVIGSFVIILTCMMMLICTVKKQERKMKQYDFSRRKSRSNNINRNRELGMTSVDSYASTYSQVSAKIREFTAAISPFGSFARNSSGVSSSPRRPAIYSSTTTRKMQRTSQQGMMYILAYFITFIFGVIFQLLVLRGTFVWQLSLLSQAFTPLQGFLNFLVYMRPQVLKVRRRNPGKSWWGALFEAVTSPEDTNQRQQARLRGAILIRNDAIRNIDVNANNPRCSSLKKSGKSASSTKSNKVSIISRLSIRRSNRSSNRSSALSIRRSNRRDGVPTLIEDGVADIYLQDSDQHFTSITIDDSNVVTMNSNIGRRYSIGSRYDPSEEGRMIDLLAVQEEENEITDEIERRKSSVTFALDLEGGRGIVICKDNDIDDSDDISFDISIDTNNFEEEYDQQSTFSLPTIARSEESYQDEGTTSSEKECILLSNEESL